MDLLGNTDSKPFPPLVMFCAQFLAIASATVLAYRSSKAAVAKKDGRGFPVMLVEDKNRKAE
jgi:hypothetical protein